MGETDQQTRVDGGIVPVISCRFGEVGCSAGGALFLGIQ